MLEKKILSGDSYNTGAPYDVGVHKFLPTDSLFFICMRQCPHRASAHSPSPDNIKAKTNLFVLEQH